MIYDTSNHEKNNIISSILNFWAQEIHSTQETSSKIWMALTCFHLFVSFFYEIFIALDFRFNFLMKGTVDLLYILLDFGRITHFWQEPTNICHDSILFSTFHSRKCLYVRSEDASWKVVWCTEHFILWRLKCSEINQPYTRPILVADPGS